jgi:hypothetical protein
MLPLRQVLGFALQLGALRYLGFSRRPIHSDYVAATVNELAAKDAGFTVPGAGCFFPRSRPLLRFFTSRPFAPFVCRYIILHAERQDDPPPGGPRHRRRRRLGSRLASLRGPT